MKKRDYVRAGEVARCLRAGDASRERGDGLGETDFVFTDDARVLYSVT